MYDRDRLWYGLTHMLKAWDVPSDTLYNTATIIHGGNHERSSWEPRTFLICTLNIPKRDKDDCLRHLGFLRSFVRG
jgi:hypothetical protein